MDGTCSEIMGLKKQRWSTVIITLGLCFFVLCDLSFAKSETSQEQCKITREEARRRGLTYSDYLSDSIQIKGTFYRGFESSSFTPCGSEDDWWTDFDLEISSDPNFETFEKGWERYSCVEFQGCRTERVEGGGYGHLGHYERAFRVRKILKFELAKSPDSTAAECCK